MPKGTTTANRRRKAKPKAYDPARFGTPSPIELEARRFTSVKIQPTGWLEPHELLPTDRHSDEDIAELAESIRQHGLREPIVIGDFESTFKIAFGYRRFRAWKLLQKSGEVRVEIPAYWPGIRDRDFIYLMARESAHRGDSLVHTAKVIARTLEERSHELGYPAEARHLCDVVPWDEDTIWKYLEVHDALQRPEEGCFIRAIEDPELDLVCECLRLHDASRLPIIDSRLERLVANEQGSYQALMNYAADGAGVVKKMIEGMVARDAAREAAWKSRAADHYEIRYHADLPNREIENLLAALSETRKDLENLLAKRAFATDVASNAEGIP